MERNKTVFSKCLSAFVMFATLLVLSGPSSFAIAFNFDDGTMQGWSLTSTDGEGRQYFAVVPPDLSSPNHDAHSGTHFIGLHVPVFTWDAPAYTQDSPHGTLVLRSPEFTLSASGGLTAWLSGGGQGSPSLAGTSVGALPATSSDGGFRGIALRNATTGTYVLSAAKGSSGNEWEQVGFTEAQLSSLPREHIYTLDLIDAGHGSWGWINMDSVTIPGTVVDGSGASAPTISSIGNQTILANTSTGALPFTIGHAQLDPNQLQISGSSSNTTLVPNANIAFGGSGANRAVTVTPAAGRSGTAVITVTVSDGQRAAIAGFSLTVLADTAPGNAATIRVDDMGTGASDTLVKPAERLRYSIREFFSGNNTRLGVTNEQATLVYNLTDAPQAGMREIRVGNTVVYDQQPYFVINTGSGARWTNRAQGRIYEKNITSSGHYRDLFFHPFRFDNYDNAIGELQYHVLSDKFHEESRISSRNMGDVHSAWLEYPIHFTSYQLYEGANLNPVGHNTINSGALLVERPNGSLFGFVFPDLDKNAHVEIVVEGNLLKVRHHANMSITALSSMPWSSQRTTVVTWGRRILTAENYNQERHSVLEIARRELNPVASHHFNVQRINHDSSRYSSWVHPVHYDKLRGLYTFETEGIPWGDAVKPGGFPNKYPGARITINNPPDDRLIYMRHYTSTPNTAVVLQDDHGFVLPVALGVTRSLGGTIADWTGAFANECPFTLEGELVAYGRSEFPVQLHQGRSVAFRPLQVVHRWGHFQVPATGSVLSQEPLYTSNVGVWCSVDLKPWSAETGDFRAFSTQPTQWAWGIQTDENIEQFGGGFHFFYGDVGGRIKEFQSSRSIVPSLSHFRQENRYTVDGGRFDLVQTWSQVPDTVENRIFGDLEIVVNEDLTLQPGERIKLVHFMSDRIFLYNEFWHSTNQNQLSSRAIEVPRGLHQGSSHIQTVTLGGSKPAFALTDKRWAFAPDLAWPTDDTFARMQANMYVQLLEKDLQLQGQNGNSIPYAIRVGKVRPPGGYYDDHGNWQEHHHYVTYAMVLEQEGLSLRAGDRMRFSYTVMSYGGKIIGNEIESAIHTHNNFVAPRVVSTSGGTQSIQSDYPWVPAVRSPDGSNAEFVVEGGVGVMTFAVEGLHSWRPVRLFRMNNGQRQEIHYKANDHDGYRSYVDGDGLIGMSIPIAMNNGAPVNLVVEQDNNGIQPPDLAGPTITSIADQTIVFNTNTGPLAFTVSQPEGDPGHLQLLASSSNTTLVPNANIVFGGSGANRTVTVTPASGHYGGSTITIIVSDGEKTASTSFVLNVVSDALPIAFDFDNGTMQGWSVTSTDGESRQYFAVVPPTVNSPNENPHSGSHFIGLHVPALSLVDPFYTQDHPHGTLVLRSPEFTLNGSGDLTAWLSGGGAGSPGVAGTSVSALPSTSVDGGFMGIALRNVNTGNYVLSGTKTANGDGWQQVRFTASQLGALPQDHVYTLDLIDVGHGSWGWLNMDSVTIPGTLLGEGPAAPPTISAISNQTIMVNTSTGALSFTVGSTEVDPGSLTLSRSSSNTTLVPTANIVFGGSGANRTVTVTPATGQLGSATITITVSDGERTANRSFVLNVVSDAVPVAFDFDDGTMQGWSLTSTDGQSRQYFAVVPPILNSPNGDPHSGSHFIGLHVPALSLVEPIYTQDQPHDTHVLRSPEFTLNASGNLTAWLSGGGAGSPSLAGTSVSALPSTSSDAGFMGIALRNVNTGNYVLSATKTSGGNEWEQVTFTAAQLAALPQNHVYTLDLIDARHGGWGWINMDTVSIPGTLSGDEPALPPTISSIAGQTILVNTNTGPLSFTVGSTEVAPGSLTLSRTSSNTTLVPNANIVFGGSGANRTVTVTPATGQTGSATITITVSDGDLTASTSFALTVTSGDSTPATFNFDGGHLAGWTEVLSDGQGRQYFAVVPPILNSPNADPHAGSHFIGLHVPAFSLDEPVYTQDQPHGTLIFRSPEFALNGSGDLTAWLAGGGAGSPSLAGTSVSALASSSGDGGFLGIALRNVNTGNYVLSVSKTSSGNEWEQVTFTAAQLAALPQGDVYTLDLIDARHGGWGWVNMDSVTIPGALLEDPAVPVTPWLAIERSGQNQARLSWPAGLSGWTLQRSAGADGGFVDADLQVSVEGDENVAYDTIVTDSQFYRLRRTP